jgi:hypothetical protein
MNQVFLDTVGLLVVRDSTDQWHVDASRALEALIADLSLPYDGGSSPMAIAITLSGVRSFTS